MAGKWSRIDKKSIGPSHADLGRRSAANFFFLAIIARFQKIKKKKRKKNFVEAIINHMAIAK